ncbi:tryptophan synthase subunit alpha [Gryllotalpicola ginsengisoli]|uniref:tryptophan synthase subunit alpha n=1 Tax=Gryllotalpicola ginsengisoli TaxID=444608 RepID=UPI0003B78EEC|nr:tryptophan synthase subunit alpha [Gryllotalpicola ginsengisoli]
MTETIVSPVQAAIRAAGSERKGALIGYLPIGFPDLATSVDAAVALVEAGVDVLELGLPYSDPVMDGPVIQSATQQALAAGFRVRDVFTAVRAVRERVDAPALVMTYWNPVLQYGVDRFADELKAAGGAGLITPDITPDQAAEWIAASDRTGLERVFLAAPTSSDERLRLAARSSRGFVYAVSTMGVTSARASVDAAAHVLAGRLTDAGADTVCVGIGISTAAQVSDVLGYADGAIVGSLLVKALGDGGVEGVRRAASDLARGTRA